MDTVFVETANSRYVTVLRVLLGFEADAAIEGAARRIQRAARRARRRMAARLLHARAWARFGARMGARHRTRAAAATTLQAHVRGYRARWRGEHSGRRLRRRIEILEARHERVRLLYRQALHANTEIMRHARADARIPRKKAAGRGSAE